MKQSLYEISNDFVQLQEAVANAEDVDETLLLAFQDTIESLELSFEEKAQNLVNVMRNVTLNVTAIDEEIKRLQAKKTVIKNKEDHFKKYLRENMETTGISKIECDLFSITLSKPAKIVDIVDENQLPDSMVNVKTTITPDKMAIKKQLQDGEDVPGAQLIDGKRRLIIK